MNTYTYTCMYVGRYACMRGWMDVPCACTYIFCRQCTHTLSLSHSLTHSHTFSLCLTLTLPLTLCLSLAVSLSLYLSLFLSPSLSRSISPSRCIYRYTVYTHAHIYSSMHPSIETQSTEWCCLPCTNVEQLRWAPGSSPHQRGSRRIPTTRRGTSRELRLGVSF